MGRKKKYAIITVTSIISLLTLVVVILDFSRLFSSTLWQGEEYLPLKRVIPFFCTLLVWIIGSDGFSTRDIKRLKIVFISICLAEVSFLLGYFFAGIGFFAACQILLIWRHGTGIKHARTRGDLRRHRRHLSIYGIVLILAVTMILTALFYPILKTNPLMFILIVYAALLGASLWMALANKKMSLFPSRNSLLIVLAMPMFFISDFMVGLNTIMEQSYLQLVANSFIWVLYAPAITLIAFSGYDFEKYKGLKESGKGEHSHRHEDEGIGYEENI